MTEQLPARWRQAPRYGSGYYFFATAITVVGVMAFLHVLPRLLQAGSHGFFSALFLATIPLGLTILFVVWVDRFEPEPLQLYIVAFVWGAGVAVALALAANNWFEAEVAPSVLGMSASQNEIARMTASVGAPLIEEFLKGLGIVAIFFLFRRHFNGPVDGIVYGALIGAGFAFTENVLYFARYADTIGEVFHLRFLDGPFSHDSYTALFGFFLGFAIYTRRAAVFAWMIPAWVGAAFFHFINNDGIYWMSYRTYQFVSNVPVAILVIAMVIYARRDERQTVIAGLTPYVNTGWISAAEANMVLSMRERQNAMNWAERVTRSHGAPAGSGRRAMNSLQMELIYLAHDRARYERIGQVGTPDYYAAANQRLSYIEHVRKGIAHT